MESNGATTLIVLAIWIGLGFACSSIWQKKGGSAGAGFALGLLLGLIGLLIVALATPSGASRATVGASVPVQSAKPEVTWTHTGFRYLLGYLVDPPMYGIWDRQAPGPPVSRFPYNVHGKSEAFDRFQEFEPQGTPVAANPSLPPPPPVSGTSGAWASGPAQ